MNTFDACVLVSGIIDDVEMAVFWKGSDCANRKNTCFGPGILASILTSCLGSRMGIFSFCRMIIYLSSMITCKVLLPVSSLVVHKCIVRHWGML